MDCLIINNKSFKIKQRIPASNIDIEKYIIVCEKDEIDLVKGNITIHSTEGISYSTNEGISDDYYYLLEISLNV